MAKKTRTAKAVSSSRARTETTKSEAIESLVAQGTDPWFVPHLAELREAMPQLESLTGGDEYPFVLETICGVRDDSQPVERYDGTLGVTTAFVAAHQSPVCQVQWNANLGSIYSRPGNVSGQRWGTGTMIAPDLMLTCGHLFDQTGGGWERPRQNGTTNIISPQEIARNMRVNFNYQVDAAGNLRAEQSFPILELIEYRLGSIDMAVCRIGGSPGSTYGTTTVSTTDAVRPEMICIIGHPAGQPKRIEAGPTTLIEGSLIRYGDIDTLGGNSGSGILRASDGRLVGVHTNGGCTSASPGDGGSNFGQRIAAIIAVSPTLQRLVRPTPEKSKVRDDIGGKLKFVDDPKIKFIDDRGSLKFRDDVKRPASDKLPIVDAKLPITDRGKGWDDPRVFDPAAGRPIPQSVRPFILSHPHHSTAWQGEGGVVGNGQANFESMLMEYEQALSALSMEMEQLQQDYQNLLAQYQQFYTGG